MFPFHSQEDVYYDALGSSSWAPGQKTSINNWVKFHNFEDKKITAEGENQNLQGSRVRDKEVLRKKEETGGRGWGWGMGAIMSVSSTKALGQAKSDRDHFPDQRMVLRCPKKVKVISSKKNFLFFRAKDLLMWTMWRALFSCRLTRGTDL